MCVCVCEGVWVCLARYDQQLGGCVCVMVCGCVWLDMISSWEGVCVCVCGCVGVSG